MLNPLVLLALAMALVIGAIVVLRVNAFLALIGSAMVVSLLAPGAPAERITRVAEGFARTAGSIGIIIALAAIVGAAMMESGASDRIVTGFVRLLGEERGAIALGATAFVLSIPVFFDTVFYLLVPLARSMHARSGRHYLRNLMAIAGGAAATHTLVPPTPGPLAVSSALGVELGTMVLVGLVVAIPAAIAGMLFAYWTDRRMPLDPAPSEQAPASASAAAVPRPVSLGWAITPIVLPVVLIAANTVATAVHATPLLPFTSVLGNPNVALLLATAVATALYVRAREASRADVGTLSEQALTSAGVIILITAAGGAFGATLQAAQVGPAIQALFPSVGPGAGFALLLLAFGISSLIKIAQGSSTVAMITTAGMLGAVVTGAALPFHPVYVATAISGGALVGAWMNDSGFWVFSRLGGVSERATLLTWTPIAAVVGSTAFVTTVILAVLVPLR